MAHLELIEGPPGGGKSQILRGLVADGQLDTAVEFAAFWASLKGYRRDKNGHYPVRLKGDPAAEIAAITMEAATRASLRLGLNVGVSRSTPGNAPHYAGLADQFGATFSTRVIDPGIDVVRERLAAAFPDAVTRGLSDECQAAIDKWYGIG